MLFRLVETDWLVPLGYSDAIQSLLAETPTAYYMVPSRRWLYFLTRDMGLIQINKDFTIMSHEEIVAYLTNVIDHLRSQSKKGDSND